MPDPGLYLVNATGDATPLATGGDHDERDPELLAETIYTHDADDLLVHEHGDVIASTIVALDVHGYLPEEPPKDLIDGICGEAVGDRVQHRIEQTNEAAEEFVKATDHTETHAQLHDDAAGDRGESDG